MFPVLRCVAGLALAGALLWLLWRRFDVCDRTTRLIVALAFFVRTLLAEALFCIAHLNLPILRVYRDSQGLWFFAIDAGSYMIAASRLASGGLVCLLIGRTPGIRVIYESVYLRTLAAFIWLLGDSMAVGILLNLLVYLACALIVVRWTSNRLPLIAISFAPAAILWSSQPLKDSFFTLLVLAFFFSLSRFFATHGWRHAVTVIVLVWAIGSMRWYVALLLTVSTWLALAIDAFRPRFRALHVLTAAAMAIVLLVATSLGADGQAPKTYRRFVTLAPWFLKPAERAEDAAVVLEETRGQFDVTGGGTAIRAGRRLAGAPEQSNAHSNLSSVTVVSRLATGLVVMFVPHAIANSIGLTDIGGGRGLWWFADAETLAFDAVAVLALMAVMRAFRARRFRDPMLWQLIPVPVVLSLALAYSVTNFGTLFRHREMVFVALVGIVLNGASQSNMGGWSGAPARSTPKNADED